MKLATFVMALILAGVTFAQTPANSVDLLWQADTYTPPLYRGHSLPSIGSKVTILALPNIFSGNGRLIPTSELYFDWQKDYQNLGGASGQGKNHLNLVVSVNEANKISVLVSTANGSVRLPASLILPVTRPKLVVYESNPLAGVDYNRAVGDKLSLNQTEISLIAEPYYFTAADVLRQKLEYTWTVAGEKVISDTANPRSITFAADNTTSISQPITISARNSANALQGAKKSFEIATGGQSITF